MCSLTILNMVQQSTGAWIWRPIKKLFQRRGHHHTHSCYRTVYKYAKQHKIRNEQFQDFMDQLQPPTSRPPVVFPTYIQRMITRALVDPSVQPCLFALKSSCYRPARQPTSAPHAECEFDISHSEAYMVFISRIRASLGVYAIKERLPYVSEYFSASIQVFSSLSGSSPSAECTVSDAQGTANTCSMLSTLQSFSIRISGIFRNRCLFKALWPSAAQVHQPSPFFYLSSRHRDVYIHSPKFPP